MTEGQILECRLDLDRRLPAEGFADSARQRAAHRGSSYYRLFEPEFDNPAGVAKGSRSTYFIATTRRSGSTLLCEAIVDLGGLGIPTEYLDLSMTYLYDLAMRWNCTSVQDYLQALGDRRSDSSGMTGMKVHWDQLASFSSFLLSRDDWGSGADHALVGSGMPAPPVRWELELARRAVRGVWPDARWIWLRRENSVKQAVSRFIAERTNKWWAYDRRECATLSRDDFDYELISRYHAEIQAQEDAWLEFFDASHVRPLVITYEDMVKDLRKILHDVVDFLGGTFAETRVGQPPLLRQTTELNDYFVRRYTESAEKRSPDRRGS
jgi:LPS sulfotransferase NodH